MATPPSHTFQQQGVPAALAEKVARLEVLSSAFDIISVAHRAKQSVATVGKVYFDLGTRLAFAILRASANQIVTTTHWERLAVQSLIADLYDEQRRLALALIENPKWLETNNAAMGRFERFMQDLQSGDTHDIARLMVALRHIRELH